MRQTLKHFCTVNVFDRKMADSESDSRPAGYLGYDFLEDEVSSSDELVKILGEDSDF